VVSAFEDPHALTHLDEYPDEDRWVTLGSDLMNRLVVVVWTRRIGTIRLISARLATARERRQYAEDTDA